MAKVKVHELAKELNIQSKEILQYLSEQNIEVKSHMSSIEDDVIKVVKKKFAKSEPVKEEKAAPKAAEKEEDAHQERPKKKSSITAVYNPQNSKQPNNRRNNGQHNNQNGNRGARPQGGARPARPQGDRPMRPQGERPQGERPVRPQGDRPIRAQQADRQGERRPRNEENNRQNQNGRTNHKPNANYNQNNRGNNRVGQNRQKESRPRLDQEINKFNKSATPVEENNGKDRRDTRRNDKKNKGQNKDNFGNKKQERYINLEKNGGKKKKQPQQPQEKKEETIRTITLPDSLTIRELADKMKVQPSEIVKKLFLKGTMVTVNQDVDYDTAEEIALEFNCLAEHEVKVDVIEELLKEEEEDESTMVKRPPVVCVMGHVDHGKTSILDRIRNAHVTAGEAGGITQHIGAYQVRYEGKDITFLDTPGHEAFTAMRARGANITDIAILVVAADDGIMPQTVESINHAKAAGITVIVAINKMDKEGANPDRIKEELTKYGMVCEEWGGDVICVPVSAKTGEGIDDLLENILLVAETSELKANPDRRAKGTVVEARLDKGRGPIATLLVQNGTLHVGDVIIAGTAVGRVRVMTNDKGQAVESAGPSVPVEITGLAEVPEAGDTFNAVEDERLARELVEQRKHEAKQAKFNEYQKVTLDNLFSQIEQGEMKELSLIVKADVQGSVEAVTQSLEKLSNDEVRVRVIHGGVGGIKESDVMLASASNAIIIGFNVRPDQTAEEIAARDKVDIRTYRVIYDAIEEIETAMKGMLAPKFREVVMGRIEVRQVYKISNVGAVAGAYVLNGKVTRQCEIRVVRDGIVIAEDKMSSLKRFKDDVKEVGESYECGITLEKFRDFKEGDIFEAFIMEEYRD